MKGRKKLSDEDKTARKEFLTNESKTDKFKRLINPRINKTVKSIKAIKNLSGSQYEYTPEQANKIIQVLTNAVENVKEAYTKKVEPSKTIEI